MTDQTAAREPFGWERVRDAFLAAPGCTLTNVQLGDIPGVQAFHQRISNLKGLGYVFTSGVKVAPGRYAYQMIGRREGSDITAPLPLLTEAQIPEARAAAEASLKEHPPTEPVRPELAPVPGSTSAERTANHVAGVRDAAVADARARLARLLNEGDEVHETVSADIGLDRLVSLVEDVIAELRTKPAPSRTRAPRQPREGRMTGPQAMAQVLEAEGKPMHSKLIAQRVTEQHPDLYGGKTPAATMAAQLATSNVKGGDFIKVSPGCFGLRAWDATKLAQEPTR